MKRLNSRLAKLERNGIGDIEHHEAMAAELQRELGLPLPEAAPTWVHNHGLKLLVALQASVTNDPDNVGQQVETFKRWAEKMNDQFRDA